MAPCSRRVAVAAAFLVLLPARGDVPGTTRDVAPGVVFRSMERPGPLRIFVVEADLAKVDAELALSGGDLLGSAKLSRIVGESSGRGSKILAAINADYFEPDGTPVGLTIPAGEVAATSNRPHWDAFFFDADGRGLVARAGAAPTAALPGAPPVPAAVNRPPADNGLALFTRRFGADTKSEPGVVEATLAGDAFPLEEDETLTARVTAVSEAGKTPIPENGAVLTARGTAADALRKLKPGDAVTLALDQPGVTRARFGVGGGPAIVHGGKALSEAEMAERRMKKGFVQARNPRTAIGWAKGKLVLVVADGRSKESVGIDLPDLAALMISLGCTEVLNLDGGGSTSMWIDGAGIVNTPSDKNKEGKNIERSIADAILIRAR